VALERGQQQLQDALVGAVGTLQQSQNLVVEALRKVNALHHVCTGMLESTVRDCETRITGPETEVEALRRSR
jgi:hypothetical protein